jgi:membrane-bound serine protease (ClpP class)
MVFAIVGMAVKARGRAVVSGMEEMTGAAGEILEDMQGEGWARVHSENWRVVSRVPLARGQKVRVNRVDGLTLSVEPESNYTEGVKS